MPFGTGRKSGQTIPGYPWDKPWTLVMEDHFNGCDLDTTRWTAVHRRDSFNDERQFYCPKNVSLVQEGHRTCLRLTALKEEMSEDGVTRPYTSGLVVSRDKTVFHYGRVEFSARLPRSKGIWPALWMLPNSGKWPPEIDVMEIHGERPDEVYTTLHWGHPVFHRHSRIRPHRGPDYSLDFHLFAAEWEPGSIRWFIDGEEKFSFFKHVPDEPFYIVMNVAVGGPKSWGGTADQTTVFPQHMDVDYVRIFQRK